MMKSNTFCEYKTGKLLLLILVFALIEITNIIFAGTPLNLIITVPQLLIVVYYIIKQDYKKAFLLHMVFIALSFDATSILTENALFSYGKLKLVGPISFVHVLMGVFFVLVQSKYRIECKDTMIYKAYKLLLTMFLMGIGVGLIGFIFDKSYTFDGFIGPFVYMTTGLVHLNILLRFYDKNYTRVYSVFAWMLLVASAIATTITYALGYTAEYSVDAVYLYNEFYLLVPCLIIVILQTTNRFVISLSLGAICLFLYNAIAGGARGMTFMTSFAAIIFFIYALYSKQNPRPIEKVLKVFLPLIIFVALPTVIIFFQNAGGLTARKFNSFLSLFSLFDFSTDLYIRLNGIADSPYIRIAEFLDIIDNYLHDIISIPFGRGYGGYYTDSLGLFSGIDLTQGSFSPKVVAKGEFPTAHSVYPSALLFNGFIGLFLILKQGLYYIKDIRYSYLCYAGFLLFCYSFYYNPLIFLASIFCLFGAEFQLSNYGKESIIH